MSNTPIPDAGWRRSDPTPSLPEAFASVRIAPNAGFWRTLMAFAGPGLLVAVGYMDPGNWATDIAGGAQYGYLLLSVILMSNLMAMLLQHLAVKLGVATGRDLAQACRDHYDPRVSRVLWILAMVSIAACDLAEVIGAAIAINLLFGIPLVAGVLITAIDVLLVLFLQQRGFRIIESIVAGLIGIIFLCFVYEIIVSQPDFVAVAGGLLPTPQIVTDPNALYLAIGILGATVMPHNLYLHSSIVQTRAYDRDDAGKALAIKFATIDSTLALAFAFFINAAILILSAATFHGTEHAAVADIADAHALLTPVLGASFASMAFAIALLASGQSSTLTGTLAGQIVMQGFVNLNLKPWQTRLVTRMIAIVPAVIVASLYGERGTGQLLVLSQVILSLQLSFAVFPLVQFTSDAVKMGRFVNGRVLTVVAWVVAGGIAGLNAYLLYQTVLG